MDLLEYFNTFVALFFQPILRFYRSMPSPFQYVFVAFFSSLLISFCFKLIRKVLS